MEKKYYLKKSYIKNLLNMYITRFILVLFFKKKKNPENVLIKISDGIGDVVIRSRLSEKLVERFGEDKVYFLMQENYKQLGEILGYKVIGISKAEKYNLLKRIRKFLEINRLGIKIFINLEYVNDNVVGNIISEEKIGVLDTDLAVRIYNKFYTKVIKLNRNEKILNQIKTIGENILGKNLRENELIPDLKVNKNSKNRGIVIAVGSTSREKVCSPHRMLEYVKEIKKEFPEEKIYLVGNGKLQLEYAEYLMENLKEFKMINLVNKTNLREVFEIIAGSRLFIGFDSGLYNYSYSLRKKTIALFKDLSNPFKHEADWVKILGPEKERIDEFEDKNYPNKEINNISVETLKKALEGMKEYEKEGNI
ncbi:glycosyltransferase family 9 protein [Fusobacterium varium]|uniref:glycosyltransferase family 9 protein n=1 Tax=Fusobacterium varium TaxID=856 RepID=UPI00242DD01E|nr:glycosyltransferase family 9 protein [Fusobacterium varium]MCF0170127.1 hypothetical protein [Fusobacterium varium]MCF0170138.1 hypothetical protein [Fusobacterium varium]